MLTRTVYTIHVNREPTTYDLQDYNVTPVWCRELHSDRSSTLRFMRE